MVCRLGNEFLSGECKWHRLAKGIFSTSHAQRQGALRRGSITDGPWCGQMGKQRSGFSRVKGDAEQLLSRSIVN